MQKYRIFYISDSETPIYLALYCTQPIKFQTILVIFDGKTTFIFMKNNDLRTLTDVEQPLDHLKFSQHTEEELRLANIILLRQAVREAHRIRKRVSYTLVLILIVALALVVLNESML